jgi:hypothetical protein
MLGKFSARWFKKRRSFINTYGMTCSVEAYRLGSGNCCMQQKRWIVSMPHVTLQLRGAFEEQSPLHEEVKISPFFAPFEKGGKEGFQSSGPAKFIGDESLPSDLLFRDYR